MSYKNKSNNKFQSYDNGERSSMVSPDALSAVEASHKQFDKAMEVGKQVGQTIAKGIKDYQDSKEKNTGDNGGIDE